MGGDDHDHFDTRTSEGTRSANTRKISPTQIWLTIFVPALLYYSLLSPTTTSFLSLLNVLPSYTPIATTIRIRDGTPDEVYKLIHETHKYGFEYVIGDEIETIDKSVERELLESESESSISSNTSASETGTSFFDMTWVEDTELGRGYLLLSDSSAAGKVWRYETGGGIIPIGKSLYLDQSGCRSLKAASSSTSFSCNNGRNGSRGMTLQILKDESRFDIGSLIVAEGGEHRIVRLEVDGARSPLVLDVPSLCDETSKRLEMDDNSSSAGKLMYSPFGDLLFTETMECSVNVDSNADGETTARTSEIRTGVYRLKEVVNIPPIPFQKSREAHEWEMGQLINYHDREMKNNNNSEHITQMSDMFTANVAFSGLRHISDMAVMKELTSMLIAGSFMNKDDGSYKFVIVKVVDDPDKDSDSGGGSDRESDNKDLQDAPVFFDMTDFFKSHNNNNEVGIALTLDANGNIFATYPGGIAILDSEGDLLATVELNLDASSSSSSHTDHLVVPTAIVIGNDGYLYVSTTTTLLRWRIKSKPLDYPTNLIVPKRK
uniref:Uncharacterized protein n=2 Tax=Chaetoceros debilis TaxID=122233 RepID=A0A7S3Q0M8_9STRA